MKQELVRKVSYLQKNNFLSDEKLNSIRDSYNGIKNPKLSLMRWRQFLNQLLRADFQSKIEAHENNLKILAVEAGTPLSFPLELNYVLILELYSLLVTAITVPTLAFMCMIDLLKFMLYTLTLNFNSGFQFLEEALECLISCINQFCLIVQLMAPLAAVIAINIIARPIVTLLYCCHYALHENESTLTTSCTK